MHREQHHDAIIDLFIILYLSICHFLEVSVTIVHQEFLVCSVPLFPAHISSRYKYNGTYEMFKTS